MPEINKKADKTTAIGALQMLLGAFLIVIFGIIVLISRIWSLITNGSSSLPLIIFLISLIAGVFLIFKGYGNYKVASRFRRLSGVIGEDKKIELSILEKTLGWNQEDSIRYIEKQTKYGFWPETFLDTKNKLFVLDYTPTNLKTDSGNQTQDELLGSANDNIHEMETVTRSIEDTDLKAQVETLTAIAKQVYSQIEEFPDKATQVRQLSNYLLPTMVKLLKEYVEIQNQSVKSDSMLETMNEIKEMTFSVEAPFKKQLDALYSDNSLDVSVEIEVMKKILDM